MCKVNATKFSVFCIIFVFKISILFGSSSSQVNSVLENLIFNAKYDQAIIYAEEAMNQSTDPDIKMFLLLKQSEIYTYKNCPEKAAEILRKVDLNLNSSGESINELNFLYSLNMALVLREKGRNIEAVKWIRRSEYFLKMIKNPRPIDAARFYFLSGKFRYETRDSINAIRYFKKSIKILSENSLPEKTERLTCLSYLQLAYLFAGNPDQARVIEAKSDSVYQSLANKNHPSLINYYLNQSFIYLNYDFNIHKAEKALQFSTEIVHKFYSSIYSNYGLLYCYKAQLAYQEHDSEKALGYFRQAEIYLEQNSDFAPYMYLLYFDLANTYYFYINDFQKALTYYRKVIENSNPWLKRSHVNSLVLSGYCYLELGDTLMAISCIKKGIGATEKGFLASDREKTYTYRCMAGFYLNIGDEEKAHLYFQKAYEKSKIYHAGWDLETDIITNLANYHRDKGEILKSLKLYQNALDIAFGDTSVFAHGRKFCDEVELLEILNNKGYALLQLFEKQDRNFQHLKEALSCQKIAIRLIEKRLGYLDNEISEYNWLAIVQTTFNNAVLYSTLLYNLTRDINYAEAGFQFAEKSRMMIVLMAIRNNKLTKFSGVPDSLIEKERQLHNEILNLQNEFHRSERIHAISPQQKMITSTLAKLQLENDRLKSNFEKNYTRYFNMKYNQNVISLHRIQESLSKNEIFLEYQLLENELIIIAISKDNITMKLISENRTGKRTVNKFYDLISKNPQNIDTDKSFIEFTENSYSLYSWLLKPIEKEIENKRLIIIPHNELNLVPFELIISELPAGNNDYKSLSYLIRKHSIYYGYSGTLLFENLEQNGGKSAAFFIPDYPNLKNNKQTKFLSLTGAQREARNARKLIGGDLFSGRKASETRFKVCAGNYKILHIASHTTIDNEIPALSSLELAADDDTLNDGIIYSYELYQFQLNAQLIVLSGCNTGWGPLKQGEGMLSLARSFLYSGAHTVAFTLWPQADQAGAEIMIGFYSGIKEENRLEDALRLAKLKYLANADPAKSHPYYWGAFLIAGKTDPIILNHDPARMAIILFLILAGAGVITYPKFRI